MKILLISDLEEIFPICTQIHEFGAALTLFWQGPEELVPRDEWTQKHKIIRAQVMSAGKKTLAPWNASINRMKDDFRVVYAVDASAAVEASMAEHEEFYKKATPELLRTLKENFEAFEDGDALVVHFSREKSSVVLGSNHLPVLGQERLRRAIYTDLKVLEKKPQNILLYGKSSTLELAVEPLYSWLMGSESRRLFFTTQNDSPEIDLESLMPHIREMKYKSFEEFHQSLRSWQDLETYEQAKRPMPSEPVPQIIYFCAHHVSSLDMLAGNPTIYATLETLPWVQAKVMPENNYNLLKTLAVDAVVFFPEDHEWRFHFPLSVAPNEAGCVINSLNVWKAINDKIFIHFSEQ
jgi:hypothetical protein